MPNRAGTKPQALKSAAILAVADILVALFFLLGVLLLYDGAGVDFRILDYPGLDPYGIPIGLFLLGLAVLTARFWIFDQKHEGPDRKQADSSASSLGFVPQGRSAVSDENGTLPIAFGDHAMTDGGHAMTDTESAHRRGLEVYDATALVGLRTVVHNGAIESADDRDGLRIVVPHLEELRAAAAVMRCLLPIRLRGREIASIRKIMRLGRSDLARKLGDETLPKTICHWESEEVWMGERVEKKFRQLVCDQVGGKASHVEYDASKIARFRIVDPWTDNPSYEVPPVVLNWSQIKDQSGSVTGAWEDKWAA